MCESGGGSWRLGMSGCPETKNKYGCLSRLALPYVRAKRAKRNGEREKRGNLDWIWGRWIPKGTGTLRRDLLEEGDVKESREAPTRNGGGGTLGSSGTSST